MTKKEFVAEGYITGDHECFCLANAPAPMDQDMDSRIYPDQWFEHLDPRKRYRLKITIESEESNYWRGEGKNEG